MSTEHPNAFPDVSPTSLGELVGIEQVMDAGIRPMWEGMPRLIGPAYAVRCEPGNDLSFHAAIYRAAPGDVIVATSGGTSATLAGGNICRIAQRRGIAGFVIDGHVRDLGDIRRARFPVLARGTFPKQGAKDRAGSVGEAVVGGVIVRSGDVIAADEDGIIVVPADRAHDLFAQAARAEKGEDQAGLDAWEATNRRTVTAALAANGDEAGLPD